MSRITKRILSLGGATGVSQAITLAALPMITRLYPPEILGILATALSVMTILSGVACLRYEQAIPLAASRTASSALVLLSLGLAVTIAFLAAGGLHVLTLVSDRVSNAIPYPFAVAAGTALLAIYNVLIMWATGRRMINSIAAARLVLSISDAAFKIGLGTIAATAAALLGAYLLGLTVTAVFLVLLLISLGALPLVKFAHLRQRLEHALFRHRRFFQLGLLETVFTTVAMQAPVILFAVFFGPAQAALLFLGLQIMRGPVTLISNAVGRVFLSELGRARDSESRSQIVLQLLSVQVKFGLPIVVFLGLAGSALADLLFGAPYAGISYYVLWMIPWMAMVFLASPFVPLLYAHNQFGVAVLLAAFGAIVRISALGLSYVSGFDAIAALSIASIASYGTYIYALSRTGSVSLRLYSRTILSGIWPTIAAAAFGLMVFMTCGGIL